MRASDVEESTGATITYPISWYSRLNTPRTLLKYALRALF